MKYELWHSATENAFTFFPSESSPTQGALEPDARQLWTVEAATWNEAQAKKHEFLGWEPYIPMEDDEPTGSLPQ